MAFELDTFLRITLQILCSSKIKLGQSHFYFICSEHWQLSYTFCLYSEWISATKVWTTQGLYVILDTHWLSLQFSSNIFSGFALCLSSLLHWLGNSSFSHICTVFVCVKTLGKPPKTTTICHCLFSCTFSQKRWLRIHFLWSLMNKNYSKCVRTFILVMHSTHFVFRWGSVTPY